MKLTKENIYINLQGKSEDELAMLYYFLKSIGEVVYRNSLEDFLCYSNEVCWFGYIKGNFSHLGHERAGREEVTIQQLKEILQPMETLQEKEQRLLKELEVVRKEIEEQNKPKVGDWCKFWDNGHPKEFIIGKLCNHDGRKYYDYYSEYDYAMKITNPQLIKLLENESK